MLEFEEVLLRVEQALLGVEECHDVSQLLAELAAELAVELAAELAEELAVELAAVLAAVLAAELAVLLAPKELVQAPRIMAFLQT